MFGIAHGAEKEPLGQCLDFVTQALQSCRIPSKLTGAIPVLSSKEGMTRAIFILCVSTLLAACAARGVITVVPGEGRGATVQSVFIATNRNPAANGSTGLFRQEFGESRDDMLRYARIDVSIPSDHVPGQIEWPGSQKPDPTRHFVTRAEQRFAGPSGFLADLGAQDVVLFVHGFNVNNAEAVYRLAQIAHDFEAKSPVIAYSWPSAGSPRGYAYDRDSVIFSRDDLEILLTELTQGRRSVTVIAHSMGSQLVMETFRQMSISGAQDALDNIAGVALISPDIDEDVFVRQAQRIKPFPEPFMLLVSTRDRVLNLSALLTGKPNRLGSIQDPSRLGDLPVKVVDLSDIEGGDFSGHSTAFTAPAAIALLRDLSP